MPRLALILAATALAGGAGGISWDLSAGNLVLRPARAQQLGRAQPPLATAAAFLIEDIREKDEGHWARAWRTLYPGNRRIVPQVVYARCERATPFLVPLQSLRVIRVRRALVRVPGLRRHVPGAAVTVRVELTWYGPRDPIAFDHTFHLVPVHGEWRWLLSPDRYRLYAREACGTVPAL
jgi:hypothetical protein